MHSWSLCAVRTCLHTCLFACLILQSVWSQDPVFTPATLTDSAGNTADSSASITWAALTTGSYKTSPSRTNERLASYHDMIHGFVTAVFAGGIPTDIFNDVLNNNINEIPNKWRENWSYFLGYVICLTVGLLFFLVFPLVACCVCCCRCCGSCGGDDQQRKEDAENCTRKFGLSVALTTCLLMIVSSSACLYDDNASFTTTLDNLPGLTETNVDDIKLFFNKTYEQAYQIARTDFDFFKDVIYRDLDNIEYLVGLPVRQDIETQTGIRATLTTAQNVGNSMSTISTLIDDTETAGTALTTAMSNLQTALDTFRTTLQGHITTCNGNTHDCTSAPGFTGATGLLDPSNFNTAVITVSRAALTNANSTSTTGAITQAETELNNIPETVKNDSQSTVNSLKTTISGLSDDINPMISEIENLNKMVNTVNGTGPDYDLNSMIVDTVENFVQDIENYNSIRWSIVAGFCGLNGFIVVIALMGVGCGWCQTNTKQKPHRRSHEAHCAGLCLTVSAVFMGLFAEVFMLLVMPLFLAGSPIERMMCQPLRNLDQLEELLQVYNDHKVGSGKYFLGDMVYSNDTVPLTVTGILRDCKDGAGLFETFQLQTQFDIDTLLDYSDTLDVQTSISGISVDLSSISIYNSDLQYMLHNLSVVLDLQSGYYPELNNDLTVADLSTLADDLAAFAVTVGATDQSNIDSSVTELRAIISTEYANAVAAKTTLVNLLANSTARKVEVDTLDTDLQATETYIQTTVGTVVTTLLNQFATRGIGIVNSYLNFALNATKLDMGKPCLPLWNVYNSFLVYTLCYDVIDVFNGFWFSLGWCMFFFLPGIIFSVKLGAYFKTMDKPNSVKPEKDPPPSVIYDDPPPYDTRKLQKASAGSRIYPSSTENW